MTSETTRPTRQQLYDRIKESSKDEVILEEMIRLGFWPENQDAPSLPETIIRDEGRLVRELNELLKKQRRYENRELLLKEIRQKRMEESRERQKANKLLKKKQRGEKAAAWAESKKSNILYLGEDVSQGLSSTETSESLLQQNNVPVVTDIEQLADLLGCSVNDLRFLAYSRKTSRINHYKRFYMPKKTGGKRLISAPMPRLKNVQHAILETILEKVMPHDAGHGFIKTKSILTNAAPHLKQDVVINLDFKDFFPTIHYKRVKGLFRKLGYSEQIATVLGLICTEPDVDSITLDNTEYFVAGDKRHLPQGAPTSPAITNIICRKLDARLKGAASKHGYNYTRYADDLTFSAIGTPAENFQKLLWQIRQIVGDEGFELHPDKLRVMRKGVRQEVTGIIVNDTPGIDKKELKRFRALIFQIEKDGPEGKHWNNSPNLLASIKGYANYVAMVKPEQGKVLVERVNKILTKYNFVQVSKPINKPESKPTPPPIPPQTSSTVAPPVPPLVPPKLETAKKKPWWKFW